MRRTKKYLQHLFLITMLMVPAAAYASDSSDDEFSSEDCRATTNMVPVDETVPDETPTDFKKNPLFEFPLEFDVIVEDLTTARNGDIEENKSVEEDKKDLPNNQLAIIADNQLPESLPSKEEIREVEEKIKSLSDDIEKLIMLANNTVNNNTDPVIMGYWWKIQKLKNVPHAYARATRELEDLKQLPKQSSEAADIRKYLDWMCRLPWGQKDDVNVDLVKASQILDREHSGLDKIKERIIEELAVRKRVPNGNPPILCFVGPPGVGKTTLAMAIAEATGRKFVRISLGGIRDEAKIRGFLRTYIASRPGGILKAIADVGSNYPLVLLDEIDKLQSESNSGDPAAALLEVLDRSQNDKFVDHYLDLPYDLSNVMFIATANSYNIAGPLQDRLELIDLSSYTLKEKMNIARTNLVPKVLKEHGLTSEEASFLDSALEFTISNYTSEAGVRDLGRCLGKMCRKAVANIEKGGMESIIFDPDKVREYLGKPKARPTAAFTKHKVGATQGLAWTSVGGTLLPIEAKIVAGSGQIIATGNLGDVMKESVTAAKVVLKWLMPEYGIKADSLNDKDIHVHAPEAAVKKDGPSAGVTITTSLISALTNIPVSKNVAMTGEINLNGEVMAIGGLKEKLIAAYTAGITRALIPKDNEVDLEDIPAEVKQRMEIIPVEHIREVLKHALVKED